MVVLGTKSGHDGALAVIEDGRLLLSYESEKDSWPRHTPLTPETVLSVASKIGKLPDVIAIGGWHQRSAFGLRSIGAGYFGISDRYVGNDVFFGKPVTVIASSHERSHLMSAIAMAPAHTANRPRCVLIWEGDIGSLYLIDHDGVVQQKIDVLSQPGARFAMVFALADRTFPDVGVLPRLEDAGKVMALAGFAGSPASAVAKRIAGEIMALGTCYPAPKNMFRTSEIYNAGVDSDLTKEVAAELTEIVFARFSTAAKAAIPQGLPLLISGGCGLNCEWNRRWRSDGHFESVFIPPCADDSGSAIGTAIDGFNAVSGQTTIDWSVYSGPDFIVDDSNRPGWRQTALDTTMIARRILGGDVVPWVEGRAEIGPRALGHRSLLAEPLNSETQTKLNAIKKREDFRPIAPCCRIEDVSRVADESFPDPFMLYFRNITDTRLRAVTHVDGTARVQTVASDSNPRLHRLLSAVADRISVGVLCNTSLNFKGYGFINRLSDLLMYCEMHAMPLCVVGESVYEHDSCAAGESRPLVSTPRT